MEFFEDELRVPKDRLLKECAQLVVKEVDADPSCAHPLLGKFLSAVGGLDPPGSFVALGEQEFVQPSV